MKQIYTGIFCFLSLFIFASDFDVVINEINYNPAGADSTEFVELFNCGPTYIDLSGCLIEAGVHFEFPENTLLAPRAFLVIAGNPGAVEAEYGIENVLGPWIGNLANDGERIIVRRQDGLVLDFIHYDDTSLWARFADRNGATLELSDSWVNNEFARNWQSSGPVGGTPGEKNSKGAIKDFPVCINEISVSGGSSWIELFNRSSEPVVLEGYSFLSGAGLSSPVNIPGVTVEDFVSIDISFETSGDNDCYYLIAPDGETIVDVLETGLSLGFASSGYYPDGSGISYLMSASTKNASNIIPVPEDVFISEIMYHPPEVGNPAVEPVELEYIGISNRGNARIDLSGWYFSKGIHFEFSAGSSIDPGKEILITKDVGALLAAYPALSETDVIGNFDGKLVDSSEKIYLRDGDGNLVDGVEYSDDGSWPGEADGSGASLCLRTSRRGVDNNRGDAWEAVSGGTPAVAPGSVPIAPIVVDVSHDPPVPGSSDKVIITCRVIDSDEISSVSVKYTVDGSGGGTVSMRDDGVAPDITGGDSVWTVETGPFSDDSIIAFHILADDSDTPGEETDAPGLDKNFLFAVDNGGPPSNSHRSYRVIVTEDTWDELRSRDVFSDDLLDATFIGDRGEIFYNVGFRYRGSISLGYKFTVKVSKKTIIKINT